jgi:ABC-2 type transport system permease protein
MQDVLGLWAIAAVSFGWTMGIFGNTLRLAGMIAQGQLDYYLSLPKNVLLHILVSRMDITAWGDMLFGTGVFVFFLRPSPDRIVLFLGLSLVAGVVFLSSSLVWQSLAFWLGNAEGLATQMWNAMILFGTYPAPLFTGFVRVVLFTVVPAAFVTYVPVQLLRDFDLRWLAAELAAAAFTLALAIWLFYRGLRRYESGSLMVMRT